MGDMNGDGLADCLVGASQLFNQGSGRAYLFLAPFTAGSILVGADAQGRFAGEVSRDNFRQLLARARRDLYAFMTDKCGLVNTANPCRCAKKTQAFIDAGYVDPKRLVFVQIHSKRMKELAGPIHEGLERLDVAYGEIYRNHAFYDAPDFVESLRALISDPQFRTILEGR